MSKAGYATLTGYRPRCSLGAITRPSAIQLPCFLLVVLQLYDSPRTSVASERSLLNFDGHVTSEKDFFSYYLFFDFRMCDKPPNSLLFTDLTLYLYNQPIKVLQNPKQVFRTRAQAQKSISRHRNDLSYDKWGLNWEQHAPWEVSWVGIDQCDLE